MIVAARIVPSLGPADGAVALCDAQGKVVWTSETLQALHGGASDAMIGRHAAHLAEEAGVEGATIAQVRSRLAAGEIVRLELSIPAASTSPRRFALCVQPIPASGNGEARFVAVATDITEGAERDEALVASEERYRRLVESCPDPIVVHSQGRIRFINGAGVTLLGACTPDELLDRPILDFVHPDFHGIVAERVQKMLGTGESVYLLEEKLVRVDGGIVDVEIAGAHIRYQGESAVQLVGRDVTQRKRAEEERRQLQERVREARRRESLAAVAEGVAHQLAGLSSVVIDEADRALSDDAAAEAEHALVTIRRAGLRMAALTQQLQAVAGEPPVVRRRVDLSQLVIDISERLEGEVHGRATVSYELPGDLPHVSVDAALMRRIALDLVRNAADAMAGAAGSIHVRTQAIDADAPALAGVQPPDSLEPGHYVALEVRDTGCGMDAETRRRMLDPFFSTKSTGRGLGLSEVLGLVRAQGGGLQIESEPGRGTTVTVLLPTLPVLIAGRSRARRRP